MLVSISAEFTSLRQQFAKGKLQQQACVTLLRTHACVFALTGSYFVLVKKKHVENVPEQVIFCNVYDCF